MKSTKNLFMTGIALVTALFASIQVNAAQWDRQANPYVNKTKANPYLSETDKSHLENQIESYRYSIDPKRKTPLSPYDRAIINATIEAYEEIYYGNKPYSAEETRALLDKYQNGVKAKFGYPRVRV